MKNRLPAKVACFVLYITAQHHGYCAGVGNTQLPSSATSSRFLQKKRIEKLLFYKSFVRSLVLDTFFSVSLRKTLELTDDFEVVKNSVTSSRFLQKNRIEKLLFDKSFVCPLVLDTFFYALLRKTPELT
ncbi:hypothetical protein [Chryseobacterium caseinilyticum]|uniref:Secreted protein n=1 Tax=Chryseobacterium caseinilyticum TaxID=2771428 RepID=A0ABR8Z6I6_9FLAO|nr:hypothetical protein [Chryseobacterium caseinilyticum]MBD8080896.1 hypothetical protein [Chryseobacterium caseinilyticum]